MKLFSRYHIFSFYLMLIIISCKKESLDVPENHQTITYPTYDNPISDVWELYSGRVFVKNLDNNSTIYYDHFGPNKNSSNLSIFSLSWLPIDIITKGMTTWKFSSSMQFILDGSSTYNYNASTSINSSGIFSVYGLENGSSRPIEVLKCTDNYLVVKIYQSNGNNGINNFSFYSTLVFLKQGYIVTPIDYPVPQGYSYGGVIGNSSAPASSLINTKWILTKYIQNFVPFYPSDTITFISNTQYTINNSVPRNYSLSGIVGNNMKSLSLYSFTTLGGDWSGQVQSTFINDWVINNSNFVDIMNVSASLRLWMVRIQ